MLYSESAAEGELEAVIYGTASAAIHRRHGFPFSKQHLSQLIILTAKVQP
jgi:hypothetical protein